MHYLGDSIYVEHYSAHYSSFLRKTAVAWATFSYKSVRNFHNGVSP